MEQLIVEEPRRAVAEYNLGATLFSSQRAFRARLETGHVLFNPDLRGLPIVVADWVAEIVQRFDDGASIGRILAELPPEVEIADALDVIETLVERGFLRSAPTPGRYVANDFSGESAQGLGIWVHINNHCNLDCEYCFVDKFKSTMSPEIVSQTVQHIRSTVEKRGLKQVLVKFAGGEPTLSLATMEDFHGRLVAALAPTGARLETGILTNGTVANGRLVEFLCRTKASVAISLDGYGAESHDIFRVYKQSRRGSWDKIMQSIEVFKRHRIPISINATISERSAPTLPALVAWIAKNGFRTRLGVVRQPNSSWVRGAREREYERLTRTVSDAFEAAFQELEKPEYDIDLRRALNICELHFDAPSMTACCGIATSHIVVQDDGRLASCPMTTREDPVEAGPDLIESARLTFKHSAAARNNESEKNCLDCRWFPVCTSGCPVTNLRIKGKPFTISPLHAFYDYVIPRYITFFGRKLLQRAARLGVEEFVILDGNNEMEAA